MIVIYIPRCSSTLTCFRRHSTLLRSWFSALPHLQVLEYTDSNMGYDAATGVFTDMIKAGIIDPLKVRTERPSPR